MTNRRTGEGPIPSIPELYINEQQVHGLAILRKFGWKLVCIRRSDQLNPSVILKNRAEGVLAILQADGILRISQDLEIRKASIFEPIKADLNTDRLMARYTRNPRQTDTAASDKRIAQA
ncbi:MAG: hypothetical protein ABW098_11850 [Candidatus Thiodiazotropha sp.]